MLLTPLKAVRSYCLGCAARSSMGVALRRVTQRPLWPWRFANRERAQKIVTEERDAAGLDEAPWAEQLTDYTWQNYYQTAQAEREREQEA